MNNAPSQNRSRNNLPNDGFGEWGRSDAILGCRDGIRTDILDPLRSWPCNNLFSLNKETFIKRGLGVLKMVRFSRQRALKRKQWNWLDI